MEKQKEMTYVFIDTSVYIAQKFVDGSRLLTLLDAAQKDIIRIVLPELTRFEVKKHMKEEIARNKDLVEPIKKLVNNTYVRHANPDLCEFLEHEKDRICDSIEKEFEDKLKQAKVIEIPIENGIDVKRIVSRYMKMEQPFSQSKPKEFPDAIVLECLELWCSQNHRKCILLSEDSDFKGYKSENLEYIDLQVFVNKLIEPVRRINDEIEFKKSLIDQLEESSVWMYFTDILQLSYDTFEEHIKELNTEDYMSHEVECDDIIYDNDSLEIEGAYNGLTAYRINTNIIAQVNINREFREVYRKNGKSYSYYGEDVDAEFYYKFALTIRFTVDKDGKIVKIDTLHENKPFNISEIRTAFQKEETIYHNPDFKHI